MNFEEEYQDVLQNIEFSVVNVYQHHTELLDYDVESVLTALVRTYQAEQSQRQVSLPRLSGLRQELYDAVETMCEWRLGRRELMPAQETGSLPKPVAITVEEVIKCQNEFGNQCKNGASEGGGRGI